MELRKRQRPAALQRFIAHIAHVENILNETVAKLRSVQKRLRRYESAPPIFPLAMLDQIKRVARFGVDHDTIAATYRIDVQRVRRILADQDMPLVVYPSREPRAAKGRRLIGV